MAHVVLMSSLWMKQSGDHYLQLITRKLRHRDVQCSLATCLLVFGNCTHNQSSDSCSLNSSTNFKNRNYQLQITQDTWTFGNLRSLKSEKLSVQVRSLPTQIFPLPTFCWYEVICNDKAFSRSKLTMGITAEDKRELSAEMSTKASLPQSSAGCWDSSQNVDAYLSFDAGEH